MDLVAYVVLCGPWETKINNNNHQRLPNVSKSHSRLDVRRLSFSSDCFRWDFRVYKKVWWQLQLKITLRWEGNETHWKGRCTWSFILNRWFPWVISSAESCSSAGQHKLDRTRWANWELYSELETAWWKRELFIKSFWVCFSKNRFQGKGPKSVGPGLAVGEEGLGPLDQLLTSCWALQRGHPSLFTELGKAVLEAI